MKIVSACLLGIHCNFEGASWRVPAIVEELGGGQLFPVCPEVLGGLPVPRTPAEIRGGSGGDVLDGKARVVTEDGRDVTDAFVEGARRALAIAQAVGATEALLTERSPSCGCGLIFDGTFSFKFIKGDGVTAALLKRHGIDVKSVTVEGKRPAPPMA